MRGGQLKKKKFPGSERCVARRKIKIRQRKTGGRNDEGRGCLRTNPFPVVRRPKTFRRKGNARIFNFSTTFSLRVEQRVKTKSLSFFPLPEIAALYGTAGVFLSVFVQFLGSIAKSRRRNGPWSKIKKKSDAE